VGAAIADQHASDIAFEGLALQLEELEQLDAPWNWGDFFGGVGIGVGIAGVAAGGIAIGITIT
jgi:hypothetical protein